MQKSCDGALSGYDTLNHVAHQVVSTGNEEVILRSKDSALDHLMSCLRAHFLPFSIQAFSLTGAAQAGDRKKVTGILR